MDIDKLFESESLDGIADNVFGVVNNSVSEVKEMQRKKVAENVQLVVNALKKIESDISSRYDSVGNALEKRIITIKDGRNGADGSDGRNGRDGKNGRDGATGPRGADGKNGLDGADGTDGVSVTNAHIDFDGSLVISLSSGHELNVGEVVAPALAEQIKVITNGGGTSQSVIDTLASLQAQITAISGASIYKGLWNASTNTPTLASGVGTSGNFYIVSVAGSTNLDGITNWGVGDWAIYNGTAWQRVEGGAAGNFTTLSASSTVTFSGLTASTALALDASKNVVSVTNTGSGNNVLATSPTITGSTLTGGTFSGTSVTDSGLTSGRVTYAGTAGLLQDSANLTFNGTTLTANTIGAFTLSGTVAGGGNQLNNVIIGTTTPLAGAFTTLSATGAATLSTTSVGGAGLRYTGSGSLSGTGVGGEMFVAGGVSYYSSYNRTTSAYAPINILGSTIDLNGAITLGGTVAGGGNQLNNVVIGTTTPLAGAFTTLSATGAVAFTGQSLTLGTATVYDAIVNTTESMYFNVDSNNDQTGSKFEWGENRSTTTGGTKFATLDVSGLAVTGTAIASTSIGVGNTTPSGGGAGIAFPATQSASTDANTLDDYEEGTFTATLKGSTTDPTVAVTSTGVYTKVGRLVYVSISFVNVTTTGAVGDVTISGLPFAAGSIRYTGSALSYNFDLNTGTSLSVLIESGGTIVYFYSAKTSAAWQSLKHTGGLSMYLNTSFSYNI